jgi:dipeptidyl aminopeptidase/acylaminoacyl peptidase
MTDDAFRLDVQWWTTHGFAVAHVNYRGSTGFGRAYMRALDGRWCDLDVDDCIDAAEALVAAGRVDPGRIAIRGGSASGATALLALARSRRFRAGGSLFGVTDLELLARETHKFEARYLDRLIGPYPALRDRYVARSPLTQVAEIAAPVIVFQGLDDRVVPPNQAEALVAALRGHGIEVEYHAFAGEGHGFRKPETVRTVLERELAFYRRAFAAGA